MGTLVSSSIKKSTTGAIVGSVVKIVVVKTNPGYAPNPMDPGTGTVVAVYY
jgi:hypothetical protein